MNVAAGQMLNPARLEQEVQIALRAASSPADAIQRLQQAGLGQEQAAQVIGAIVERRREGMLAARRKPALKNLLTGLWGGLLAGGIWFFLLDGMRGLGPKPFKTLIVLGVGVVCAGMFIYGLWQRFSTVSDREAIRSFRSPD